MLNNLPVVQPNKPADPNADQTLDIFNNYYTTPITVNQFDLIQLTGFFESRNFQQSAAETLAASLAAQASRQGYSISRVMDTLNNLNDLEIAGLLGELLNYDRINTSFLGTKIQAAPFDLVSRNVRP